MKPYLVLGVGNPMFGDDGFGIEAAHAFEHQGGLGDDVEVMDGGTCGIYLLPYLEGREQVWILDAVHFRGTPGEMIVADAEEVNKRISIKMSEHQVTLNEVLALLELMGTKPGRIRLIGVQPKHMIFAGGLSDEVRARIPEVLGILQKEIRHVLDERAVLA